MRESFSTFVAGPPAPVHGTYGYLRTTTRNLRRITSGTHPHHPCQLAVARVPASATIKPTEMAAATAARFPVPVTILTEPSSHPSRPRP